MADPLQNPYVKGGILTLKIHRCGSKNALPQLNAHVKELRVRILDVIEPSTMSVVLKVEPQQDEQTASAPTVILKLYDRQFSAQLREFQDAGAATSASEAQFIDFVRKGYMPQFLKAYGEDGTCASGGWNAPELEAYFYTRSIQNHEIELEIYDRLLDMQGVHVPTIFADIRLPAQNSIAQTNESLVEYTEVRGILMEYISGFPLDQVVTKTSESDWAPICDQAIEIIRKISDSDFINFDIQTRNIIVRSGVEGSYQVFYLDFAQCRFRDPSDSDEIWRARKSQKNEEGAVGYVMMNYISRAKGKKGKKYKGPLPLPWEYTPSSRFDGEYIELYEPVEKLCKNAD